MGNYQSFFRLVAINVLLVFSFVLLSSTRSFAEKHKPTNQKEVTGVEFSIRGKSLILSWKKLVDKDFAGCQIKCLQTDSVFFTKSSDTSLVLNYNHAVDTFKVEIKTIFQTKGKKQISKGIIVDVTDDYQSFFNKAGKFAAHRGFSSQYPENTLLAFTKAAEAGFDYVECDIRLTADNIWVVCHDDSIHRTANGRAAISKDKLADLKKFNFGNEKKFPGSFNEKLPTLSEFLKTCKEMKVRPFIEVKISTDSLQARKLMAEITNVLNYNEFSIISFHLQTLVSIREVDKKAILGLLCSPIEAEHVDLLDKLFPSFYDLNFNSLLKNKELDTELVQKTVKSFAAKGIYVAIWTLDDQKLGEQFLNNSIKIITTNKKHW
jgi:glycerophosphoryl diester phosphodiesterase